jgi:hypothetical protein
MRLTGSQRGVRAGSRGFTVDKNGNVVTPSIGIEDVYAGGVRFLTANHGKFNPSPEN